MGNFNFIINYSLSYEDTLEMLLTNFLIFKFVMQKIP